MATKTLIRPVVDAIGQVLRLRGYRKRDLTFWRDVGEVRQLVNVQRSTSSTASEARFTINLAALCPKALASWELEYSVASAPWSDRIGTYGVSAQDNWWIVTSEEEARVAAEEVLQMLSPALEVLEAIDSVSKFSEALQKRLPPLAAERYIKKLEALRCGS